MTDKLKEKYETEYETEYDLQQHIYSYLQTLPHVKRRAQKIVQDSKLKDSLCPYPIITINSEKDFIKLIDDLIKLE